MRKYDGHDRHPLAIENELIENLDFALLRGGTVFVAGWDSSLRPFGISENRLLPPQEWSGDTGMIFLSKLL